MTRITIKVPDKELNELLGLLNCVAQQKKYPGVISAVNESANKLADRWRNQLQRMEKKPIPDPDIRVERVDNNPLEYRVYSEDPRVVRLEIGTPELDMKKTHPFGPKSRISPSPVYTRGKNKGKPKTEQELKRQEKKEKSSYLIVPFSWKTKTSTSFRNVIPTSLYNILSAKNKDKTNKFKMSTTNPESDWYTSPNAQNPSQMVQRQTYKWGDRIKQEEIDAAQRARKEPIKRSMMKNAMGMVRMDTSTPTQKNSKYFTFRVISTKSPPNSWIRKGKEGKHIARAIARHYKREIHNTIEKALREALQL